MLGSRHGAVVGIDQCVSPIKHPAGLSTYLKRVHQVACEARDGAATGFNAVRAAICNNTAIELNDAEVGYLRAGCMEFFTDMGCLVNSGDFESHLQSVSANVSDLFARGLPS